MKRKKEKKRRKEKTKRKEEREGRRKKEKEEKRRRRGGVKGEPPKTSVRVNPAYLFPGDSNGLSADHVFGPASPSAVSPLAL